MTRLGMNTSKTCNTVARESRSIVSARIGKHSARLSVVAQATPSPLINVIPKSQWDNGVPPVMGAHLMASGVIAPLSTSKGAGVDLVPHLFQYHTDATKTEIALYITPEKAAQGLATSVIEAAAAAIKKKGSFTLVLSGGSLISQLSGLVGQKGVEWSKWFIFFVDERNVPHSSPDSNFKGANEALLSKVPIPEANIISIAENMPATSAAIIYEGRLLALPTSVLPRNEAGLPVFDLMLLGVGPDGHIGSLFPNTSQTAAVERWVLPVEDSPKPPSARITMTMPVINASKECIFVCLGDGKAEIVSRTLEVQSLPGALPAQMVRPTHGKVRWVLDVAAAQYLDIARWGEPKRFPRSDFTV
jgi:6-phosphogluconolactonase